MTPDEIEQMKRDIEAATPGAWKSRIARLPDLEDEVLRLRRVIFQAQQLGEAGMLDEMLATIDADTHELEHRND